MGGSASSVRVVPAEAASQVPVTLPGAAQERQPGGEGGEPVTKEIGDSIFGYVAQQDRGDRDPELGSRELAVQVLLRCPHRLSLPIALPYHRLDPGSPRRHESELGRHEEGVRDYQDQYR